MEVIGSCIAGDGKYAVARGLLVLVVGVYWVSGAYLAHHPIASFMHARRTARGATIRSAMHFDF